MKNINLLKLLFLVTILFNSTLIFSQLIINEVMFNPNGNEYDNEFIELYNNNSDTLSLENYSIGDNDEDDLILEYPTFSNNCIPPYTYALILDSSYPSSDDFYQDLIPDSISKFIIEDGSFGKYGFSNTKAETIYLKQNGTIVDSISYSLKVKPGYSYEKKYFNQNIWNSSQNEKGTPGFRNSTTPYDHDLFVTITALSDTLAFSEEETSINYFIKNVGLSTIGEFNYEITLNNNIIDDKIINNTLVSSDSLSCTQNILLEPGMNFLKIIVRYENDENIINNSDSVYLFYSPLNSSKIVLNEFIRKSSSSHSDWIEIYNPNNIDLPLPFYKISDNSKKQITLSSKGVIKANDYQIICKDSSIFNNYDDLELNKISINPSLPDFNNSDTIYLYSLNNEIIDSLEYQSNSWNEEYDYSLEKINPELPSFRINNWNICVNQFGSPTHKNSIFTETNPAKSGSITLLNKNITPDNDGNNDNLGIKLNFNCGFVYVDALIYNKKGQKIRTIHHNAYFSAKETFFWNCSENNSNIFPTGAYILLLKVNSATFTEKVFKKVFYIIN